MKTAHFKEKLEEEKKKLESELSSVGQRNPAVANDWEAAREEAGIESDLMDQADIVVNRENTAAILADLEARYDRVLAALARIEKGTYGVCEVCSAPIEEARLEADPSATTCVAHV
ncbi:MAG: TraR/DksA family transcriptional regulator [Candidatus Paceibacteria bacterium]